MAHIPVPDNLLVKLRRAAQQDGLSLARLFENMLEIYLASRHNFETPDSAGGLQTENKSLRADPIDAEAEAYLRLHPILLKDYPNQYVAIYRGRLVDHDADKLDLYARIEESYPNEFVLIRPVQEQPDREFYFRSSRYIERV